MAIPAGGRPTFARDMPLVYQAREATHCILVQSYP
jgi:hypothetical protein